MVHVVELAVLHLLQMTGSCRLLSMLAGMCQAWRRLQRGGQNLSVTGDRCGRFLGRKGTGSCLQ